MKYLIMLMLPLSLIITVGCEDDEAATPAAVDCAALLTTYAAAAQTFSDGITNQTATNETCQANMDAIGLVDVGCPC